jgi:HK97 family phage major capsid protein
MSHISNLLQKRSGIVDAMRAITSAPAGHGGDLSDEQNKKFDEHKSTLESIDKQIERNRVIEDAERRLEGAPLSTGDKRLDEAMRDFSIRKAIVANIPDLAPQVDCARERELSQELARRAGRPFQGIAVPVSALSQTIEKRVITTAAPGGGPGSNIIATDHMGGMYIDRLRARMITRRLGARVISGLSGNVDIPKLKASATTGWVAENSALTPSDAQFTKVQLTPKHAGGIVEFSRNMLMQSSPDIEALIRDDFAKLLAEALDRVAINGGGSNEPDGILQTAGVDGATTFATPSWSKVLELIEKVESGDAEGMAFATNPKVVRLLRSTLRAASTDSRMIMESPNELAGYPLASTTLVPSDLGSPNRSAIIFGNWADQLIGFWSELDILVNPYEATAYSKGNVQVRAMMTCDVALRHTQSFAFADDVNP